VKPTALRSQRKRYDPHRPATGYRRHPGRDLGGGAPALRRVGYERATLRGIASAAGIDAKLILYYYGSKEGVFQAAVAFPIDPAATIPPLLEPGLDGLGIRMVGFFVAALESPASSGMLALIRSAATSEPAAALVREYVRREILARVAAPLQLDQPELRASLVASQLVGLAVVRYVIKLEPLASASPTTVKEWLGPTLQRYLTEPSPSSTQAGTAFTGVHKRFPQ
jgi:AcrR family transcriptional regulator